MIIVFLQDMGLKEVFLMCRSMSVYLT